MCGKLLGSGHRGKMQVRGVRLLNLTCAYGVRRVKGCLRASRSPDPGKGPNRVVPRAGSVASAPPDSRGISTDAFPGSSGDHLSLVTRRFALVLLAMRSLIDGIDGRWLVTP